MNNILKSLYAYVVLAIIVCGCLGVGFGVGFGFHNQINGWFEKKPATPITQSCECEDCIDTDCECIGADVCECDCGCED